VHESDYPPFELADEHLLVRTRLVDRATQRFRIALLDLCGVPSGRCARGGKTWGEGEDRVRVLCLEWAELHRC
jgi:hypothetical protein